MGFFSLCASIFLSLPPVHFHAVEYGGYYRPVLLATQISVLRNKVLKVVLSFSLFFAPTPFFGRHDLLLKCEGNVSLRPSFTCARGHIVQAQARSSSFDLKVANDAHCHAIDLDSALEIDLVWATTVLTSSLAQVVLPSPSTTRGLFKCDTLFYHTSGLPLSSRTPFLTPACVRARTGHAMQWAR